ncbi:tRNA epoxyqueuosine(34) reductase QueG [Limisphaera ngatamarikiensis]|uniref:tRNA epoxyqueuosine(34) reductase QueG n=1 Tax=Limisphaera ngatamarikiensis TaxID=1324935 RepID=A0A6M1RR93_9BACT|nr:tRNA epoxyqueuosine(34) reductase QueG [Limisphaera ngatamarikiensis]NGO39907.1 tRNA epoxyqueuosine(34) reductase QueG [Limisphaera ngatamarikiensis]
MPFDSIPGPGPEPLAQRLRTEVQSGAAVLPVDPEGHAARERIRSRALELGFDECRFTTADPPARGPFLERWLAEGRHGRMQWLARRVERRTDPRKVLPGASTLVMVAVSYGQPEGFEHGAQGSVGVVARYARALDYHDWMGERLRALAAFVEEIGPAGTRTLWYVDTGPILERELAERAGVGFVGKHTNLISRRWGNWLLLGEVLTTWALPPDQPEHNRCGRCTRCMEACPTGAIVAPFQLDARLCISYLTIELRGPIPVELRPAIGNRIFGCDDCLAVCPWNRFAREGRLMRQYGRPELGSMDLTSLLELDEPGFRRLFGQTPIARARYSGFRRNVCVALGNVGGPECRPALERAAQDADPLVAEHARWALARLRERGL